MNNNNMAAVLVALVLSISWAVAGAEDPDYAMVCRGGFAMKTEFEQQVLADRPDHYVLRLHFRKSHRGAGAVPPGPGECAWFDRPIGEREPDVLEYRQNEDNPVFGFVIDRGRVELQGVREPERSLINAVQQGAIFLLRARRDEGVLEITHVGP